MVSSEQSVWSLTSLCHSNGHIETMPVRELIPLLPWPGFNTSFSGHSDRRAIISEQSEDVVSSEQSEDVVSSEQSEDVVSSEQSEDVLSSEASSSSTSLKRKYTGRSTPKKPQTKKFCHGWLHNKEFSWLIYDGVRNLMRCRICSEAKVDGIWGTAGTNNFRYMYSHYCLF